MPKARTVDELMDYLLQFNPLLPVVQSLEETELEEKNVNGVIVMVTRAVVLELFFEDDDDNT